MLLNCMASCDSLLLLPPLLVVDQIYHRIFMANYLLLQIRSVSNSCGSLRSGAVSAYSILTIVHIAPTCFVIRSCAVVTCFSSSVSYERLTRPRP
jgi:hypothetical protein